MEGYKRMNCPYKLKLKVKIQKVAYDIIRTETEQFGECDFENCPLYDEADSVCLRARAEIGEQL